MRDAVRPRATVTDLLASRERAAQLRALSIAWPSWTLTTRQICDLELLLNGAFSPLTGFMARADYESVCANMRLCDGALWPIPIVLDVPEALAQTLRSGDTLALRGPQGTMRAALHVDDVWQPDRGLEADAVYGTTSREHPGVAYLLDKTQPYFVGGRLEGVELPTHYDFASLRLTPADVCTEFARLGWDRVAAFHTRGPMHRAHHVMTLRAAKETHARLLIQAVVGTSTPGEFDHYTRVRCCQAILDSYPSDQAKLSLLPLATRMAGPRETLWHALVSRNFGCTHFIVGAADDGPERQGRVPFYQPHETHGVLRRHQLELGVEVVAAPSMVYVEELGTHVPGDQVPAEAHVLTVSGSEIDERLDRGIGLPEWYTFPEVARELERARPPRTRQGFTLLFTGLSGAGKSTIANVLRVKFLEMGGRAVTLLDGDVVRQYLSSELGFSREHRDINIRRIGYVASEITKNGGIAICAPIAPYARTRQEVREMIEAVGGFVLVHVATSLAVCEGRDRKGLYAKARAGLLPGFTGVSDPYEAPTDAEVVIDGATSSVEEAASMVLDYLTREGFVEGK